MLRSTLLWIAFVVLAACSATAPDPSQPPAYTLVYLKTGPTTGLSPEQSREIFAGHFANMQRLAAEGHLVVAGPFGKQRSDPALRGLFILTTGDRALASELAESDPGFRAGVFAMEYHDLVTHTSLRAVAKADLIDEEAAKAAGRTLAPQDTIRPFVLLTAEDGERARAALPGKTEVVLTAQLDGRRGLFVLDLPDLAAAQAWVAELPAFGEHRLDEWYGSKNLIVIRR